MKTNELYKGQIVKNYKEMCALVGEEVKTGTSKKAQIKEWERHILFHKDGQKFIIDDIYKEVLPKNDKRYECKHESSKMEGNLSRGVYCIELKGFYYIGSTKVSFKERAKSHRDGSITKIKPFTIDGITYADTKNMMKSGATFNILEIMDDNNESEIRLKEEEYINQFTNESKTVVNANNRVKVLGRNTVQEVKTKYIKVNKDDYDRAINILLEYGISINI